MHKKNRLPLIVVFTLSVWCNCFSQSKTEIFEFVHNGKKLSGFLDLPAGSKPKSIILIIPGYGKTNVASGNAYRELRSNFTSLGIAVCLWDKPGCGKSEGVFDPEQTVQSSASESIAAINELKRRNIDGSNKIGLWGISRAGWICPLVIQQYPSIAYWISVSGTDDKENFGYLLETNLRIEGRSEDQTKLLVAEWFRGNDIFRKDGSFDDYQLATQNLRKDPFWIYIAGEPYDRTSFLSSQKKFIREHHAFDEETGLMIYIPDFNKTLETIRCPVLAIFGEKDGNVDWRKTDKLYRETIGKKGMLTVRSFKDCNHNMKTCKTGGYRESNENKSCDGYYDAMSAWLKERMIVK